MDPLSILSFLVLFLLSAFFSGSETALMSLPQHKIDSFIKQKKVGAELLARLKKKNERLLIMLLIGNNLVNVTTASLATKIAIDIAAISGYEKNLTIGISTGIITLLLLLFGEIFPKAYATRHSEKIALYTVKIHHMLGCIFFPIVVCIEWIVKKMGKKRLPHTVTDEDIVAFLEMSYEAGVFAPKEYKTIKNMIDFYETTAEEIMIPRTKIDAISMDITVQEAFDTMRSFSHSRIPIYTESIDHIDYFITFKDVTRFYLEKKGDVRIKDLQLKKILSIPLNQPIHTLLTQLQRSHTQIALVVDEYGGTAGIVTVEDIVEEVFGEIRDETDKEKEPIRKTGSRYIAQSQTRIYDVRDAMDITPENIIANGEEISVSAFDGETVGYFITSIFKRFPKNKETTVISFSQAGPDHIQIVKKIFMEVYTTDATTISEIKLKVN